MRHVKVRKKIPYLWVSFAEQGKDALGVVLIRARNLDEACFKIIALDIIPDDFKGQVAAFPVPEDKVIPEEATNRLLAVEDIRRLFPGLALMDSEGVPI